MLKRIAGSDTSILRNAVESAIRRGAKSAASQALSRESQKQRSERAAEWKQFRRDFLFSQGNLADALGCSRRTVVAVEGGKEVTSPHYDLLRKFRDLRLKHEAQRDSNSRRWEGVA